jgi:hypothetical protein
MILQIGIRFNISIDFTNYLYGNTWNTGCFTDVRKRLFCCIVDRFYE